ncbi:hypothetical protein CYMTET_12659 [Cymbomonas tetramitiformis]|uniref:Uncharacterized protein n=1 Tax=Cymbomonas tetramitiformis TaxID=36881 RepID=A0AAE0GK08_9CHLO|nr:hypothetical protein CYMTET_12659 [Cymbomonas tetramitiformis]
MRGCVSTSKLKSFLRAKWIPGRTRLPTAYRDLVPLPGGRHHAARYIDSGHLFDHTNNAPLVLYDFVYYVLTRPETAVPPAVRSLLLPVGFLDNHTWLGDLNGEDRVWLKPTRSAVTCLQAIRCRRSSACEHHNCYIKSLSH